MVVASNMQRNHNPRGTAGHPQSHFIHVCYVTGGMVEGGTAPLCLGAQMDRQNVSLNFQASSVERIHILFLRRD